MKQWQKTWLIIISAISILHFIRDISQDMGIKNILSTPFVKEHKNIPSWYWFTFNTYVFEIGELCLVWWCVKKKQFGIVGYVTILWLVLEFSFWLYYWFFL